MNIFRFWVVGVLLSTACTIVFAQGGYQPSGGLGAVYEGFDQANRQNQAELQNIQSQLQLLKQVEALKRERQQSEANAAAERERQAKLDELLRNPESLYQIGLNAANSKDFNMAFDAFNRSASLGYPPAQMALGVMYETGKGVGRDLGLALIWYKKAAEAGDAFSQFKVGMALAYGIATPKDEKVAIFWFTQSAAQGFTSAQSELGSRLVLGKGTEKNWAEALNWSLKAAYKGDAVAQMVCGLIYLKGYPGLAANKQEGIDWLTKSAAQGNDTAVALLKEVKNPSIKKPAAKRGS